MSNETLSKVGKDAAFCITVILQLVAATFSGAVYSDITQQGTELGQQAVTQIVVTDSSVENYDLLLSDLELNFTRVVIARAGDNPIELIQKTLSQHRDVEAVHIVSHGAPGQVYLSGQAVDAQFLNTHQSLIRSWSKYLHPEADILLYGCDVASGAQGQQFLNTFAALSSADIAASNDKTGHYNKRGDWVLESHLGDVDSKILFSSDTREAWQGVLQDFVITESSGSTSVSENATTDTFTVVLDTLPLTDVVIDVSSDDIGEAIVNSSALTFTNTNWNIAQTITVTGVDDALIDGAQVATLTLSVNDALSDDAYDSVADQAVSATNNDNDTAAYSVAESGSSTLVNENGSTDTFTVVLDTQPNSNVVFDISSSDTGEATVSPASLTFTSGNWNVAQTVTVTGVDDILSDGTQNSTITVSINAAGSDDNFDLLADETLTAATADDDTAGFVVLESGGATSVNEDGTTDSLFVVLSAAPSSNVVLDASSDDTSASTVSPASLTFTPGNWNVAQTITVQPVDDILIDGPQSSEIRVEVDTAASDNSFDPAPDQFVNVTTVDDDIPGFIISETSGSSIVNESGTTDTFTIRLSARPDNDVVFDISSADTGEVTVSPTSLDLKKEDWNVPHVITLTGVNDGLLDGTQYSLITISVNEGSSDDAFDFLPDQTITAITTDDDSPDFAVIESNSSTSTDETATTDTFDVVLTIAPASNVVLDISSSDTGEVTVGSSSLTFTPGNWSVTQTVTVTGVDDAVIDGVQNSTITVAVNDASSDNNFDPLADKTIVAANSDDDTASYSVAESGGSTTVTEGLATDTFTVVLDAEPSSNVVFDISSADTGEATVSPASLTFTTGDWNVAQTVTVTGVDDAIVDGSQLTTITVSVNDAASDVNFDPLADQTVTATTTDDDVADFTITESAGSTSVDETATTDSFTVVLDVQPVSNVVFDVSSADTGEATVSPASLTFTTGNWNVAQTVTVTGVNDNLIDGTQNTTVTVSVDDAASDDSFDPLADKTVTAATTDDDVGALLVIATGGTTLVNESGSTDTVNVSLTAQPTSNVVVDVTSLDLTEGTASPTQLTFTPGNWNVDQPVTITGVDDALVDGLQLFQTRFQVNAASSDDDFDAAPVVNLAMGNSDNDVAGITVTESAGSTAVDETATTDTFTVVLTAQPSSNVVLDISSADTGEATVSPASLTFTPGNWNLAQTVTVTGVDDALIDGSQNTTITISVNDASSDDVFDPVADETVTAATADDDAADFTITETVGSTDVTETGTTDTFTVVLTAQPLSNVVFDVSSADTGEATVSPATLTFTPGNWNVAQTVTVTGVDDALLDGTQNTMITVAVNDAASDDSFDPLADKTVTAATADNDSADFTITESGGSTSVDETATTDTFTVVLTAQPLTNVVFNVSSADTGEATVSPAMLTFTPGNWNVAQTVTVTGVDDVLVDGTQNSTVTITVNDAASDDSFDPLADKTVTAATTDNDSADFTITESGGSTVVSEAATTDTFTVVLTAQPLSNVAFDISSADTGEAIVSPATLTFTPGNWNSAQTVTVTGVDDALIDGAQAVTLTIAVNDAASDDSFDPLVDKTVSASNNDNDVADFTVTESAGNTSVDETASSDTFTVVLTAQPTSNVVFDVSSADTGEATVSPATLTFTTGNWNVAQTVTVTGVDDAVADGTQNTTLTIAVNDAASDDDFDLLANKTVTAATTDDDAADFTVTESAGSTGVTEAGATDTFTVVLTAQPVTNVVFDVSSADTGEATVSPATLTFTPGNWNIAQTVTVTGVDDALVDGAQLTTLTVAVNDAASDDGFDPLADKTVSATTTDNDTADFTITESGGSTAISEPAATDSFTVVLTAQPTSNVVLDISSADTGEATVSAASLTFTPGNWNSAQTVTVTGVDDALIDGTQNTLITVAVNDASSDDSFDPLADKTVSAATADNDAAGFTLLESGGSSAVSEAATTDTFTVVLDAQPNSNVVLDVSSADTGEVTVAPVMLTFTPGNWNVAQTVTMTGVDDALIDGLQNTTVTVAVNDAASDDNFDPLIDQNISVATTDNDTADFTIVESSASTVVNENASTDTFTVVLTAQPASNVVIDVSSADTAEATVAPASLTFTPGNWNITQTVTVTGVDDALIDGTQNTNITLSINDAASDNNFDPISDKTVSAATTDNDSAGFTVTETAGSTNVSESGASDTFSVVLNIAPATNVVFDISSADTTEATITPASLTFTPGNWNIAQTATVTGVDDALVDGTQNSTITITVNDAASDDNFDPLADQIVTAINSDNDAAGFTVAESAGSTAVSEAGTSDTFTVVLNAEPASNVVFAVSSADTGEATVSPAALTFTPGNWNIAQTVTVTGIDDILVDGAQISVVTIAVNDAASDDLFDPLPDQTLNAQNSDDDAADFTVLESGGSTAVSEAATNDTFTVVLDVQPSSNVVLDISSADTGEATVSPASLTFTSGNWNIAQTVTVTGVDDALIDGTQNSIITIAVNDAASDDSFDPIADKTVTTTNSDNDMAGFTLVESGGSTSVDEAGSTDTFTAVLTAEPASNVVLDIISADTGEATVSPASVTFTPANWNVAQTVTVTGVDDVLLDGNQNTVITVAVNDAASDDDFDSLPDQTVTASTADNDAADFIVNESGGSTQVSETATTDAFTVVLNTVPGSNVVLDISSADIGEAAVSPASVTFTPGNWNVAQTITVTGVDDAALDGSQNTTITIAVNEAASDDSFDPLMDKTVNALTADDESLLDSDNDGIPNAVEGTVDTDGDGTPDYLDIDSDNDGIPDSIEERNIPPLSGADLDADGLDDVLDVDFTGGSDLNFDGIDDALAPSDVDADGSADYLDVDSDNDGVPDGLEGSDVPVLANADADADGIDDALDIDIVGGSDGNNNGIRDAFELRDTDLDGNPDVYDIDSDNDGILDGVEADASGIDTDVDGIDDRFDVDQTAGADVDADGVDDALATDTDGDGRSDFRELDSDNDSVPDVIEAGLADTNLDGFADGGATTAFPASSDADGIADYRDIDRDNDAVFDIVMNGQAALDLDLDGRIDAGLFTDPDWDGVPNVIDPAPTVFGLSDDPDGDGVPTSIDRDDDNDGIDDAFEAPGNVDRDTDADGIVDRLDRDSDNDGIPDSVEGFNLGELDTNYDGVIDDTSDADNNGLSDAIAIGTAPVDTDGDGVPDYLDRDSDNDGLSDILELVLDNIASYDSDGNGLLDSTTDSDADGLADIVDPGLMPPDSDADAIANFRDPDSDNDGFGDDIENGDFNDNGVLDSVEDGGGIETGGGGSMGMLLLFCLCLGLVRRRK